MTKSFQHYPGHVIIQKALKRPHVRTRSYKSLGKMPNFWCDSNVCEWYLYISHYIYHSCAERMSYINFSSCLIFCSLFLIHIYRIIAWLGCNISYNFVTVLSSHSQMYTHIPSIITDHLFHTQTHQHVTNGYKWASLFLSRAHTNTPTQTYILQLMSYVHLKSLKEMAACSYLSCLALIVSWEACMSLAHWQNTTPGMNKPAGNSITRLAEADICSLWMEKAVMGLE